MYVRRPELPRINPIRFMELAGGGRGSVGKFDPIRLFMEQADGGRESLTPSAPNGVGRRGMRRGDGDGKRAQSVSYVCHTCVDLKLNYVFLPPVDRW